jgi:hypothetical protein
MAAPEKNLRPGFAAFLKDQAALHKRNSGILSILNG